MPTSFDLAAVARTMKDTQDRAVQIEPLTAQFPGFDLRAAYDVAHQVCNARRSEGAMPVGRKIGFTNPDMWALYGVREPIWGYMYDRTVVYVGEGDASCSLCAFTEPKIEPEVVFHFRSSPPVGGDLPAILESIDWVAHGFEVVRSHFSGWRFQAADTVADGGLHGALLIGQPQPVSRRGADLIASLQSFSLKLSCNAVVQEIGHGSNVLGSPLAAIAHLVTVLAKQPQFPQLQAGDIVTTGTITAAHSISAGEVW